MTTSQKAALSLLISVLLFGAFTALTYTGLFDLIEARFYNASITSSLSREISRNADAIDNFLAELQAQFSATLKDSAIRRSFLSDQRAEDIYERTRIYGLLVESVGGLQWIRFLDSGGARIHFSTYGPDILQQDRQSVSYRNYSEPDFPYEKIAVNDGQAPKYTFDEKMDRIIFSFPFYDSFEVYRGTALFSLSVRAVSDKLINEGRIKAGQDISIISNPQGFLSGMSTSMEKSISAEVASIWREGELKTPRMNIPRMNSTDSDTSLALISVRTSQGFFVGRLINEEVFSFPRTMKIILLASFFITVYLSIFLLFNIRQDSVTIVQNRLKQLQISLIEQYYERKGDVDWNRWSRELEQRRDEISVQLKRGIKTPGSKKGDIDALVDKSWDELIAVIGGRKDTGVDEEKLQIILNRVLAALPGTAAPGPISPQSAPALPPAAQAKEKTEAVEEAEAVEEVEPAEEGPAPAAGAEGAASEMRGSPPSSAAGELEEIEELEELEELTEEAEPVEQVEEPEELEELEELTEEAAPAENTEGFPAIEIIPAETEAVEQAAEIAAAKEAPAEEVIEEAAGDVDIPIVEIIPIGAKPVTEEWAEPAGDLSITPELEKQAEDSAAAEEPEELEELEELEEIEELEETESGEVTEIAAAPVQEFDGEIPVIDTADMNLSAGLVDEVVQAFDSKEDVLDLEELGGLEEAGEQGDEEAGAESPPSGEQSRSEHINLDRLASQIEFSPTVEQDTHEDTSIREDFEIVSPFATLLFDFSGADDDIPLTGLDDENDEAIDVIEEITEAPADDSKEEIEYLNPVDEEDGKDSSQDESRDATLEEDKNTTQGISVVYRPFFEVSDHGSFETLEALPGENGEEEEAEVVDIIEEREGIHYINQGVLKPVPEAAMTLDKDFKDLVDSIIK